MSDVSKSLFVATILFTSMSPVIVFSQEPSPNKTRNVEGLHDSLLTEPTSILIVQPELDSLRTMAAAIVARNKHIRIQEPEAASGEPKQLEAELWLQPEISHEIVETLIAEFAKFGIVRIQLFLPFHDPDNTVVITAPTDTPRRTIKDLQTNLALPDGFKLEVLTRDHEPSPSITPPQEIQSQITQLEVELAVQKLKLGAEHPSIKSLEERIAALRKAEKSEPKPPVTVLPLRHAKAKDVAEKFKQLDLGPVDAIVVDERTNSLMIRGTERQIKDIEQLIEVLDAEVSPTGHGQAAQATTPAAVPVADGASPLGSGGFGGRQPFGGSEPGKQMANEAGLPDLVTVKVTASKAAMQHPELRPLLDDLGALDFPVESATEPAVAAAFITVPGEFSRKEWITLTSHLLDAGGVRFFFVDRKPDNKVTELTIFVKATSDETGKLGLHAESTQAIRTQLANLPNLDVKYFAAAGDVSQLVRFKDEQDSLAAAEIKAFSLQHVAAQEAQRIIVELFEHDGTAISAEQKSNTLLVRGEPGRLAEIEAILMRLDEKAAAEPADATKAEPRTKVPANPLSELYGGSARSAEIPIAEYRRRLNELEKPVLDLAEKVRTAGTSLGKEHPEYQKLLVDLRALVQQTFTTRQDIQRAELAEFTRRLERMKQAIKTREKISDKIVNRRVEELLNPDTAWDAQRSRLDGATLPISRPRNEAVASAHVTEGELITKTYAVGNYVSASFFPNATTPTNSNANPPASIDAAADKIRQKAEDLITQISSHNKPAAISFDSARLQLVVSHTAEGHRALGELFAVIKLPMQEELTFSRCEINEQINSAFKESPVWTAFDEFRNEVEDGGWIGVRKNEFVTWFKKLLNKMPAGKDFGQPTPLILSAGVPYQFDAGEIRIALTGRIDPSSQKPQLRIDYSDLSGRPSGTRMISDLEDLAVWIPSGESLTFLVYESAQGGSFSGRDSLQMQDSAPLKPIDTAPDVTKEVSRPVQIRLISRSDGRLTTVSCSVGVPMEFYLEEGTDRVPYQLTFERNGSNENSQAWLNNNAVPVEFLADDQERATAGQLVSKVIFLNSDTSSVETISGHGVEAGVDPVSVAAQKGTVIGVVRISKGPARGLVGSAPDTLTGSLQTGSK